MAIAFAFVATLIALVVSGGDASHHPRHVHISLGVSPSEMIVTWSTSNHDDNAEVKYGKDEGEMKDRSQAIREKLVNGGSHQYVYHAVMTHLNPNAKYYYQVGSDEYYWSETFHFKTFPEGNNWTPRLAIYGDLGHDGESIPSLIKAVQNEEIDLIMHVGDIAYNLASSDGKVGDTFLKHIEPIASQVPYMTAMGNHEIASPDSKGENYDTRFNMPGGNNRLYTFAVGPVRFVVLNTEEYGQSHTRTKSQKKWLEKVLTEANLPENRQKQPWIFAAGHKGMYCSCSKSGRCKHGENKMIRVGEDDYPGLEDVFYENGVDFYFAGHEHNYERNYPVYNKKLKLGPRKDNPYYNPGATIYYITGAAGKESTPYGFQKSHPVWSAHRETKLGYSVLTVHNATHVSMKQLDVESHDKVIDSITVVQERHGGFK